MISPRRRRAGAGRRAQRGVQALPSRRARAGRPACSKARAACSASRHRDESGSAGEHWRGGVRAAAPGTRFPFVDLRVVRRTRYARVHYPQHRRIRPELSHPAHAKAHRPLGESVWLSLFRRHRPISVFGWQPDGRTWDMVREPRPEVRVMQRAGRAKEHARRRGGAGCRHIYRRRPQRSGNSLEIHNSFYTTVQHERRQQ